MYIYTHICIYVYAVYHIYIYIYNMFICQWYVPKEGAVGRSILHMRNLLGWLRLGWLKMAYITLK